MEKCAVIWEAYQLGLEWGGNYRDPDLVHFALNTGENRSDLIDRAAQIVAASYLFGVAGLLDSELYMLYGVFTPQAAWWVINQAELDLRPSSRQDI